MGLPSAKDPAYANGMPHSMRTVLTLLTLAIAGPAAAQSLLLPGATPASPAEVRLIEGWQAADGSHVVGLEIRLAPGWYTYWRVPGDAGIPPVLDWSGSTNLAGVRHEWPRPTVFDSFGMRTIGYSEGLVLPVVLTPARADAPVDVALDLFFGVCDEICIPAEARIEAQLAPGRAPTGRARIDAARADRPRTAAEAGVTEVSCGIAPGPKGPEIVANVTFGAGTAPGPLVVIEAGQAGLRIGPAESRSDGHTISARAAVHSSGSGGPVIDRNALRLTVIGPSRAVEIEGCRAAG